MAKLISFILESKYLKKQIYYIEYHKYYLSSLWRQKLFIVYKMFNKKNVTKKSLKENIELI